MCFNEKILPGRLSSSSRTGRKTTKYKRGAEPVWPAELEEALLEGLERYKPPATTSSASKYPRRLQRFPQRNKIIAQYIFDRTAERRTAKQVGSRLQQLRETSNDPYILGLIKNKCFAPIYRRPSPATSATTTRSLHSSPAPTDFTEYDFAYNSPSVSPNDVHASMQQQQDAAIEQWRITQGQQQHDAMSFVWEQITEMTPAAEYSFQQPEASSSMLAASFSQLDLTGFESQQLTLAAPMAEAPNAYGAFFSAPEFDISVGSFSPQHQSFDYTVASPISDVDSSLYAYSAEAFNVPGSLPQEYDNNGNFGPLYLPRPSL